MSGVAHSSMGSKEMNYVLRVLGPAACRCPDMFKDVITQCLRISLPPPKRGECFTSPDIQMRLLWCRIRDFQTL